MEKHSKAINITHTLPFLTTFIFFSFAGHIVVVFIDVGRSSSV